MDLWSSPTYLSFKFKHGHYLVSIQCSTRYLPAVFAVTFNLWHKWNVSTSCDAKVTIYDYKTNNCLFRSWQCVFTLQPIQQLNWVCPQLSGFVFYSLSGTAGATYFTLKSSAARRALSMLRARRALSVVASNTWNRFAKETGYLDCKFDQLRKHLKSCENT